MNLYNQEIRAVRTAIEHLDWMLLQPQYKEIKPLLIAKKEEYFKEIKYMLDEEDY